MATRENSLGSGLGASNTVLQEGDANEKLDKLLNAYWERHNKRTYEEREQLIKEKLEIQKKADEEIEQHKKEKLEIQKKAYQEIEKLKKEKFNIQKKGNEEREQFTKNAKDILVKKNKEREQLTKEMLEIQKKADEDREQLITEKLEIQKKTDKEKKRLTKEKLEIQKKADEEREQLTKEKLEIQKKSDEDREQLIKEKMEIQKKADKERKQLTKEKLEIQKKADEEREQLTKEKLEIQEKADEEREQLIKERDEAQKETEQNFFNLLENRLNVVCEDMHSADDGTIKPNKDDNYTNQPSPVSEQTMELNDHLRSEKSDLQQSELEEKQIANIPRAQDLKLDLTAPPFESQCFNGKIHPEQLVKEHDEAQESAENSQQNLINKENVNQRRNRLVNCLKIDDGAKKTNKDDSYPKQRSSVPERAVEQNRHLESGESNLQQCALAEQQRADIPSVQELKKINSSKLPLIRQFFKGTIHPDAENLFRDGLKPVLYPTKVSGKKVYLTRKEFTQKFPGKQPPTPQETENRKTLRNRIRRRISIGIRRVEDIRKSRAEMKKQGVPSEKLPPIPALKITNTVKYLIKYFFLEYVKKGKRGLPVRIERDDPEKSSDESSDEFAEEVLAKYKEKPSDYEETIEGKLKGWRNSPTHKRKATPSELVKARRAAKKMRICTTTMKLSDSENPEEFE